MNEVSLEFSATIIRQHPITQSDVDILVSEAKDLMAKENAILRRGGDPNSELAGSAWFRSLPSAEANERNAIDQSNQASYKAETVKDKRVDKNAKQNKMSTTLKDNTGKGNKASKGGDHKNSKSCIIV